MDCVLCRQGQLRPGRVTVTLTRGEPTVIIKEVSADVCENCDEYYLSDAVSTHVMERAQRAVEISAEGEEIVSYAA